MEPKDEPKKTLKDEEQIHNNKKENNNDSTKISESDISKNNKSKNPNQFIKLELNKENFQIIQKKEEKKDILKDKEDSEIKKEPDNIINKHHKALSDKNVIDTKNIQEDDNKPQIKIEDFKEVKKSRSQDIKEINYYRDNNNQTVYNLLNSYYKDIDLTFINKNINNKGKNFLLKNKFKEQTNQINPSYPVPDYNINNINTHSSQNNYQYNYPFIPYSYYQNQNMNSYLYNNNQTSSNTFPENAFTINNQYNYHYSNNVNYYNYNFKNNKYKYSKRNNNENFEYKLYLINIDNIIKGIDNRTTVMIRHIPNRYTYQNLIDEINVVCKNKYDFLYLPIDSENNCNLGYAFINFINSLHIIHFYHVFKSRKWLYFNSFKECDLTFAKYQGKNELISNIEKNIGKSNDKKRIPMTFEIKNPPKIDLYKKYYEMIKKYKSEYLNDINWIQ